MFTSVTLPKEVSVGESLRDYIKLRLDFLTVEAAVGDHSKLRLHYVESLPKSIENARKVINIRTLN